MLPDWVKKLGKLPLLFLITIVSALFSVVLSWILRVGTGTYVDSHSLIYSLIIPLVIAPVFGYYFINILFELDKARTQLVILSMTDELTGAFNRRCFLEKTSQELLRAKRYGQVFSILSLDLDDFKTINDHYGHPAGDKYLRAVAELCKKESRSSDVLARFGGDEFAILAPGLDQEQVLRYAERLKDLLAEMKVMYQAHFLQSTASIGVVTWVPEIRDMESLFFLLDKALYVSKREGKNKTSVARIEDIRFTFVEVE